MCSFFAERWNRQVHRLLGRGDLAEGESLPPYTTDEEMVADAIHGRFGPLRLSWREEWRGTGMMPHLIVQRGRRKLFKWICEETRAECLCRAVVFLAAREAGRRSVPKMPTGFYWFRPLPDVPFFPYIIRDRDRSIVTEPFWFQTTEPVPVFVTGGGKAAKAIGVSGYLDWPEYSPDGGGVAVPVRVLPGDFGPRIEPPLDWHADYHPEHLDRWGDYSGLYDNDEE